MNRSGNFEELNISEVNQQNISIIKRFFVFTNSTHNNSTQLEKTICSKVPITPVKYNIRKKLNAPIFPAGFFQKIDTEKSFGDSSIHQTRTMLETKKGPEIELTSFLLGMNTKIHRDYKICQEQVTSTVQTDGIIDRQYSSKLSKTSPSKTPKYKDILDSVRKMRNKPTVETSLHRLTSIANNFEVPGKHIQIPLPILEKKGKSNPEKQIHEASVLNQKPDLLEVNTSIDLNRFKGQFSEKRKLNKQIDFYQQISPKKVQKQDKHFQKGYMHYDKLASTFYTAHEDNLLKQAQIREIPGITARSYIAINTLNLTKLISKKTNQEIQIASLSKIMTCYLCIQVCTKYEVDMHEYSIRVSDRAAEMPGTSAELQAGDLLTVNQMLFALMLPSGNDASVAVAESIGRVILKYKKKPTNKTPYEIFLGHMNLLARELRLELQFQNPSGLSMNPNTSTAVAIAVLSTITSKNQLFQQIVNTKEYEVEIRNERFGLTRKIIWKNTNKLLWKGWEGIKTGTTESAGHCLMSLKGHYLIGVFDCQTLSKRFTDCSKIYQTLVARERTTL